MNLGILLRRESLALAGAFLAAEFVAMAGEGVTVRQTDDRVRIEIAGEWFGDYHYQDVSRPFVYPLMGPGGLKMTRDWPMAEAPGEERDHPHHKSFWYAHGAVNGQDFWSESANAGRTVHEKFLELSSGSDAGVIRTSNRLEAKNGTVVCTDERTLRIYNRSEYRLFDYEVTIHASHGEVTLGDTKEGTMALRLAETMRLKPNAANAGKSTGRIVNSEGVRDGETWGKRAKWVDYSGPVEGRTMGVAIFDHPGNPRHPTWWHVRDYGLFAANPFGVHDFEKKPAGTGDLRIPAGQSLTFRYRFYIHRGDATEANAGRFWDDYARAPAAN